MAVKLLTVHHLEFQSLKGGCLGSSESTLVKLPHCWKSHAVAQIKFATALRMISNIINIYPSFSWCPSHYVAEYNFVFYLS